MSGDGIVWIASYPKSGNTWVRCLIASLLAKGGAPALERLGTPNGASRSALEDMLDIPVEDLTQGELSLLRADAYRQRAREGTAPRCLKVHDRFDPTLFPDDATLGVVLVVRDPRDVAPSWAHHMGTSLDQAIDRMGRADWAFGHRHGRFQTQALQMLGSWSDHVRSWLDGPEKPSLLLRYEDLLNHAAGQALRLAAFLGLPKDETTVGKAVAACRFNRLQAEERANGFVEKLDHMDRFFRQGRAGAWTTILAPEQVARLEADHGDVMARLGYEAGRQTRLPAS